jgi:1,4-alpha-glucan branching enzyme
VANLAAVPKQGYRIGLPQADPYIEVLNTDLEQYGGSGVRNANHILPEAKGWDGQPASYPFTLPPLSVLWLVPASQLG